MKIEWIDVSIPIDGSMTLWPGDPAFTLAPVSRIAKGDNTNASAISMGTHIGTHVDAPWHFEEDGKKLHEIDTAVFFGEALLLDFPDADLITADLLGESPLPPRVLFKTRNSDYPVQGEIRNDYVALDADAAQRLVDDGVKLVGVDYLSVAPYKQEGQGTHHRLLRNNVYIVEGLRLGSLVAGTYRFIALPLPLVGADGAPCRAFVGSEERV
ncbi:MAG TPA: cyclase family protein [Candidatus Hydrogenedentes bacterium]|nr:cyclase family protein [Candidatus Hydrogenedentota bacterium]HIJ73372.1 cyclase family protein [Candidatus Hydrogenedentota bacterium]